MKSDENAILQEVAAAHLAECASFDTHARLCVKYIEKLAKDLNAIWEGDIGGCQKKGWERQFHNRLCVGTQQINDRTLKMTIAMVRASAFADVLNAICEKEKPADENHVESEDRLPWE